jgi:hypothetical protein
MRTFLRGNISGDAHPDEDLLLLALEQELGGDEQNRVEQHLGSCWSCRARSEEMKRGILAFVDYREKRYLPSIPAPSGEFADFSARLRRTESEPPSVRGISALLGRIHRALMSPMGLTYAGIAGASAVILLSILPLLHPTTVSAKVLLTRAAESQNPAVTGASTPNRRVARQTVRIQHAGHTVVREFEWRIGAPIPGTRWNAVPDPMLWGAPLTAAGFTEWHDSLDSKTDRVAQAGGLLTLDTTTRVGEILEARMVVRAADFHPVEQHLWFAGQQVMDFTEIGFEIREAPSEAVHTTPSAPESADATPAGVVQKPSSAASVLETEMQLRYMLYAHHWDLGEDLTLTRDGDQLVLTGTVSSSERERGLREVLGPLPNVRLAVHAPDKAAVLAPETSGPPRSGAPAAEDALLKVTLETAMPSDEHRRAFVERCIAASDIAVSHGWALKRLADRYTEADEHLLSPDAQKQLWEMLHAHLDEIRRANNVLDALAALLPASAGGRAENPAGWRESIQSLFEDIQHQDHLVANLIVASKADGTDQASASRSFVQQHQSIGSLLDDLTSAIPKGR